MLRWVERDAFKRKKTIFYHLFLPLCIFKYIFFVSCISFFLTNICLSIQMPNLREKSILLVKMMTYIEKRFPDELELNAQFLDLVNYVYR